MAVINGIEAVAGLLYLGGVSERATNYQAQLFSPFAEHYENVGRVQVEKQVPIFLCNGTDATNSIISISKNEDATGIETGLTEPVPIPARSSRHVFLSIVYGGPAIYNAILAFTPSTGSAQLINIEGTRADPYGISIEVGSALNKLVIRGGIAYGWTDDGVEIELPFSLKLDEEYFFEFSWDHGTGDHSIYVNSSLVATVNLPTETESVINRIVPAETESVINRIVPGTNSYSNPDIVSTQAFDNIVLSTDTTRSLSIISTLSECPRKA